MSKTQDTLDMRSPILQKLAKRLSTIWSIEAWKAISDLVSLQARSLMTND